MKTTSSHLRLIPVAQKTFPLSSIDKASDFGVRSAETGIVLKRIVPFGPIRFWCEKGAVDEHDLGQQPVKQFAAIRTWLQLPCR